MNSIPSQYRHTARIWAISCLVSACVAIMPGAASAMSLVAVHAPDGPITVALMRQDSGTVVAVSRSVGLMEGTTGTERQASLGQAPVEVSRSVGLMEGTDGTEAQAELGTAPDVTRAVGLMVGAPG